LAPPWNGNGATATSAFISAPAAARPDVRARSSGRLPGARPDTALMPKDSPASQRTRGAMVPLGSLSARLPWPYERQAAKIAAIAELADSFAMRFVGVAFKAAAGLARNARDAEFAIVGRPMECAGRVR